jgi:dephospho-CoA kinase
MKLFGLTGGIGMGKSTSAKMLGERGVPVIDTDVFARQIVQPGEPALAEIRDAFGNDIIDGEGRLRRDVLARRVFSDANERRRLEAILHPRIRRLWLEQAERWRAEGQSRGVVVIPLLFETGAEGEFDTIICAACAATTQLQRLKQRGWTPEQIAGRLAAQLSVEEKIARSNHVIWTEGDLDVHAAQLERILKPAA